MNGQLTIAVAGTGLCIVLAASGIMPAVAVDTDWQHDPSTPGDWFEPANWTSGVPHAGRFETGIDNGGTALIAAGDARFGDYLNLGSRWTESGTLQLGGTATLTGEREHVGLSGTGRIIQTGGTNTLIEGLDVGISRGSNGRYELTDTGLLSAPWLRVGYRGTGNFIQTGGTNAIGWFIKLGVYEDGNGTYELSGDGRLSADWEGVGHFGATGRFVQSGGTNTIREDLWLGYHDRADGTYQLSGNGSLSAANQYIAYEGTGRFTQTGGTNLVSESLYIGHSPGANGTYELRAGSLSAGMITVRREGNGTFTFNGGLLTVGTFVGDLVDNGGTIAPGPSTGLTTIDGDLTVNRGMLQIEIGGLVTGTEFDQLSVTGNATLGGKLNVRLTDGFVPGVGDTFTIMTFDSRIGDFDEYNGLDLGPGLRLEPGFTDHSLVLEAVAEPSTLLLLSIGGVGLLVYAWRRKRRCLFGPGGSG